MIGLGLAVQFRIIASGVDTTAPSFVSAEVGSQGFDTLVITMDETLLATSVPATTAFAVDDGAANAVTNVSISGRYVILTLTNTIDIGDTVTVAYTKPGSNVLQDLNNNETDSWTAESVSITTAGWLLDPWGELILDPWGNPIPMPY
jgi:uncharacterized repeat protein (TIGR02059 family)